MNDYSMNKVDEHGNVVAGEGITRCACGCKYWENDKCIDCGATPELNYIRRIASEARYMNEVKLNVMLTTWEHSMGLSKSVHTLDLIETTNKYRAMGVIQ